MNTRRFTITRRALCALGALFAVATVAALPGCAPENLAVPTPTGTPAPTSPPAGEPSGGPVLTWEREGGIAGFCDRLSVTADGSVTAGSCKAPGERAGSLTPQEHTRLEEWLIKLQPTDFVQADDAQADAMAIRVTLAGRGATAATAEDQQAIQSFAAALYARLAFTAEPTVAPPAVSPAPEEGHAADAARDALAAKLGIGIEQMVVREVTAAQWPDGCLGLPEPGEVCTLAIVPGFRVLIDVEGKTFEVRTNREGTVVRIAG